MPYPMKTIISPSGFYPPAYHLANWPQSGKSPGGTYFPNRKMKCRICRLGLHRYTTHHSQIMILYIYIYRIRQYLTLLENLNPHVPFPSAWQTQCKCWSIVEHQSSKSCGAEIHCVDTSPLQGHIVQNGGIVSRHEQHGEHKDPRLNESNNELSQVSSVNVFQSESNILFQLAN